LVFYRLNLNSIINYPWYITIVSWVTGCLISRSLQLLLSLNPTKHCMTPQRHLDLLFSWTRWVNSSKKPLAIDYNFMWSPIISFTTVNLVVSSLNSRLMWVSLSLILFILNRSRICQPVLLPSTFPNSFLLLITTSFLSFSEKLV